jgi:DNA uptake protein ComE-like DNA-binding protein
MEQNEYAIDLIDRPTEDIGDTTRSFSYLLACIFCLALAIFFSFSVIVQTGDVPIVQLQTRINPNDAPAASLIRLPGIGMTRAEKIVAYRQANICNKPAFKCPDDLQKVNGIGPVIAAGLSDYLRCDKEK